MRAARSHFVMNRVRTPFDRTHRTLFALIVIGALLASRPGFAINCGQTLTGDINPASETESHTFVASAGDVVAITVAPPSGSPIEPLIKLFDPVSGQVLLNGSSAFCAGVCIPPALPSGGAYRIDVNDSGLNEVGAYDITLQPLSDTLNGVACGSTAFPCGETLSSSVDVPADSDGFTFDALSGEVVGLTYARPSGSGAVPTIRLFDPTGAGVPLEGSTNFCSPTSGAGRVCVSGALPDNGTYTVVVWDGGLNQTGPYDITLQPLSDTLNGVTCGSTAFPCGESLSSSIDFSPADSDGFTFDALSGEVVGLTYARPSGSGAVPTIRLFDPTGAGVPLEGSTNFCSPTSGAGRVCVSGALPDNGTYTVVVWDGGLNQTGPYDITLQPLSDTLNGVTCGSTAFPCGKSLSSSVDVPADSDGFTFDALSGEVVGLTYARPSGSGAVPTIRLFDPTGAGVPLEGSTNFCNPTSGAGRVCVSGALPDNGTYTIVVWDGGLNQTGPYNITLEALSGTLNGAPNGPPTPPAPVCGVSDGTSTLFCGRTLPQNIDVVGDSDSFSFDVMLGEVVILRTTALGSGVEPTSKLFGPGGQVALNGSLDFCSGQCESDQISTAGTHTFVVWDGGLDEAGAYEASFRRCEIPVRANDAYLHVASTDTAVDPIPIDLAKRGISPLDPIDLVRLGDFRDSPVQADDSTELCGVFSQDDVLDVQSAPHRLLNEVVPVNQPPNGGAACVTAPTDPAGESTDIPEDFRISPAGQAGSVPVGVETPAGATHLFIAAPDEKYGDNSDPDGDFKVMLVPEPGLLPAVLTGLLGLTVLRRRRDRL